jgi:type VI secretion system protein ImpA
MASPPTIDLDALLKPISESEPAGIELKDDPAGASIYYAIKDAREAARSAERILMQSDGEAGEGAHQALAGKPDWKIVVRLASAALSEKTKDVWIAAWLLEGLTRLHGFAGLRDGFELIGELCERYWDGIHPRPDDDGVATTVAHLAGLNCEGSEGALLSPIAAIPITEGSSIGPLTGRDYADAEDLARTSDPNVRAKRVAQGTATLEMFDTAARETSPEFFANLRDDISAAIDQFNKMTKVLSEKCGDDLDGFSTAPPSSKIAAALANSFDRVRALGGPDAPPAGGEVATIGTSGASLASGNIVAREEAFQLLMKVADYFRRAEPHSPVSYALEQAVRWGRMPLPELIKELVTDESVRRDFFRRTGMPTESDKS